MWGLAVLRGLVLVRALVGYRQAVYQLLASDVTTPRVRHAGRGREGVRMWSSGGGMCRVLALLPEGRRSTSPARSGVEDLWRARLAIFRVERS